MTNNDGKVPSPSVLPALVRESFRRHREAKADQSETKTTAEGHLEAFVATGCLDWQTLNHLRDHLEKTLPLATDPEQLASLARLAAACKGWIEIEISNTREALKLLKPWTYGELDKLRVGQLKKVARELWRRGIVDPKFPMEMRRLAIYTGSGVWKCEAIQGILEALNPELEASGQSTRGLDHLS